MSTFRITQRSIGLQTLAGLQHNLDRLGTLQQQLSSGKLLSKPSDSPTGTVSAMQFRSEIRTNEQWSRNANDAIGWLGTIDKTLTDSLGYVGRARELVLGGMNSGATSPGAREAMAIEIDKLREGLIGAANTTYLNRPIFGGTTSGGAAYDNAGGYVGFPAVGPPTEVSRTLGAGASVRVDITGPEVFGAPGSDLFQVLSDLSTALRAGDDAALKTGLTALDTNMRNVQSKLADVGARYNRVEQMRAAADHRVISLTGSLSEVEDVDLPKTIVDLQMQQVAYQAALGASQRIITPSLVDFLS